MKVNNISFPHPVLGVSDDVQGDYKIDLQINLEPEKITLIVKEILFNETLENLIKEKKAFYCAEINCPKTLYREAFIFSESEKEITLNAIALRDDVEIGFFIIASSVEKRYIIKGMNPDYEGYAFSISPGDILAYGGHAIFMAEKKWEDVKAISSFMVVDKYNQKEGPVKYDLSDDYIKIQLSENDYFKFKGSKDYPNMSNIFHTALVYPALMYALNYMFSDGDDYCDLKWFKQLKTILNEEEFNNIDTEDFNNVPKIAQMILNNPLNRTLNSIEDIINRLNEDLEA